MERRRSTMAATSQVSDKASTTALVGCPAMPRKYRSDAVRSFTGTSEEFSRRSVGIKEISICRSSCDDASGEGPSVIGFLCAFSSSNAYADKAPMACHDEMRFSLRKRATSRRGVWSAATSASPSKVSPSRLPLRCSASNVGKVAMARLITRQSDMQLASSMSVFKPCRGRRCKCQVSDEGPAGAPASSTSAIRSSGMPSASLFCARCKCSRQGKRPTASSEKTSCQLTIVLLRTSVRTWHLKGARAKRSLQTKAGAPRGDGNGTPSAALGGTGAKRVFANDNQSSRGQSSQIAATSDQLSRSVLSNHKLLRFGRLQSPSHTSSWWGVPPG
mmetsp:Transcript_86095/g.240727  ORF Transcript_86095/g.240727 Transcript_86095/m.240727 type:complete len:331 (+) Transcript_86095:356-1348(+)